MAPERSCQATKVDGEPCGAPPSFVDPRTGLCWTHSEEGREKVREAGRKGGRARARKNRRTGLDPDELPPLESPQAAETWCDVVGRAAVTGRVGHKEATAALRAVREWRESHEAGEVTERLDGLLDALAEWRETGDPAPVLELVE